MLCPVVPNSYHLFAKGQWLELGCEEGPGLGVVGAEEEASSSADGDWTPMPSLSLLFLAPLDADFSWPEPPRSWGLWETKRPICGGWLWRGWLNIGTTATSLQAGYASSGCSTQLCSPGVPVLRVLGQGLGPSLVCVNTSHSANQCTILAKSECLCSL